MKIGKCQKCESKKVYIEKDGKCVNCLKKEGDKDSTVIMKIDILELDYSTVRNCIERAKSRNGFVRIEHDRSSNLPTAPVCDLDVYETQLCYYSGPLDGRSYHFDSYEGSSKEERITKALVEAYEDILREFF